MHLKIFLFFVIFFLVLPSIVVSQPDLIEVEKSMENYIEEHHLGKLEGVVHKLVRSRAFLQQLLVDESKEYQSKEKVRRGDVDIGADLDVYVRHITDHQSFTMILVPIRIHRIEVYDTILFSVLEVSDKWLKRKFPYKDLTNDSLKSALLSAKNHYFLGEHIYEQALKSINSIMGEVMLNFDEDYVYTSTVNEDLHEFSASEKRRVKQRLGFLKNVFSHSIGLNIEINIYVFGYNHIEVTCINHKGKTTFRVTPSNIFQRHHFNNK